VAVHTDPSLQAKFSRSKTDGIQMDILRNSGNVVCDSLLKFDLSQYLRLFFTGAALADRVSSYPVAHKLVGCGLIQSGILQRNRSVTRKNNQAFAALFQPWVCALPWS